MTQLNLFGEVEAGTEFIESLKADPNHSWMVDLFEKEISDALSSGVDEVPSLREVLLS